MAKKKGKARSAGGGKKSCVTATNTIVVHNFNDMVEQTTVGVVNSQSQPDSLYSRKRKDISDEADVEEEHIQSGITKQVKSNKKRRKESQDDIEATPFRDVSKALVKQNCPLLNLPPEITEKIWEFAVYDERQIKPFQVEDSSNMFVLGNHSNNMVSRTSEVPTVVPLSLVCHRVYGEVAGIFYQINDFVFSDPSTLLAYLVAITPARRNTIRSIKLSTTFTGSFRNYSPITKHARTMLAACEGLQRLSIDVDAHEVHSLHLFNIGRLRGLQTFSLALYDRWKSRPWPAHSEKTRADAEKQKLIDIIRKNELVIRQLVCQPGRYIPTNAEITAAQLKSRLEIHGGGRLGDDKKPGMVASRTRGQLRRQSGLSKFGVATKPNRPKFDSGGELSWVIQQIMGSRRAISDNGDEGVEFNIRWSYDSNCYAQKCNSGVEGHQCHERADSWEELDKIFCQDIMEHATTFFCETMNYDAYGRDLLRSALKSENWAKPMLRRLDRADALIRIRDDNRKLDVLMRCLIAEQEFKESTGIPSIEHQTTQKDNDVARSKSPDGRD